jgi:hypothetical protein
MHMTAKQKLLVACGAYLAAVWIIAVMPLASVLYEYGNIQLCSDTSLGWFIATLYGAFFIYPVAIGGLSMAALLLPLATAITLARSSRLIYVFLTFYLITTAIIAGLEFHSSPNAVFQMPPETVTGNPAFFEGLRGACNGDKFAAYQEQFRALFGTRRSFTNWSYYLGFVAQALMQNALFVVFIAFLYYPKKEIERRAPYLSRVIFFILGYAIFLGSIWCLFRISYRNDMQNLLNQTNPFGGDVAIIVLYGIVLAVFVAYFEFNLEKLAKTISQISQFLVFIGGVALVSKEQAHSFFGARASIMNIVVLFLLFVFISALTLAFLLRPQRP